MHNIEHKPLQEEPSSIPEQKSATTTERQKLPRAWRYTMIVGTVSLVFALIIAGLLTFANQKANPSPHPSPAPTTSASTLPTPTTTPIPASIPSSHNVSMAIADGVAYLSTADNSAYALRISDGALLWHQKIDGSADQPPVVKNGVVYVASFVDQNGPAHVYALRASDGRLLWRYDNVNYSYLSLSTTDNHVIYVASQDGISALNGNNGTLLWHFATKASDSGSPLEVNGVVYFNSSLAGGQGTLYALQAKNGTPIWHYTTDGFIFTPRVANGVVYINSDGYIGLVGGTLAALRASDGHQIWKQTLDANLIQPPQLVNGILYTTTTKMLVPPSAHSANPLQGATAIGALLWKTFQSGSVVQAVPLKEGLSSLYAVRASDGTILWHYSMNNGKNSWANWFSVEHGVVYASAAKGEDTTDGGDIYALQSSNGSVLWHVKLNRSPTGALLANDIIYLSTSAGLSNGAVYALRARDGSLLWDYHSIAGPVFNAPILDGTTIYIGASNGIVYALRADDGGIVWHNLTAVQG